jgi:small GTP-binding protein
MSAYHGIDRVWKIVVGGAGGVGKTTILHRYVYNEFIEDTQLTVGVQFHTMHVDKNGIKIALAIWDLGGQERFRFVLPSYVKGATAALVLFDMGRVQTFLEVNEWIDLVHSSAGNVPVVLVGTKFDTIDEKDVMKMHAAGENLAKQLGCVAYISTSAKLGYNVKETVDYLIDYLLAIDAQS